MSLYNNVVKLLDERCGHDKEVIITLATISEQVNALGNSTPSVRMVCSYYEDGVFYVSTDATSNKMKQISKNNAVSIGGLDWFCCEGYAESLGWVKEKRNANIRAKFHQIFDWFADVGDEDNQDSIVLRITPTKGTVIEHEEKGGPRKYEVDFVNQTVS